MRWYGGLYGGSKKQSGRWCKVALYRELRCIEYHCILHYFIVLCNIVSYCIVILYYTYCITLYSIVLIVSHCIVLYLLYCIVLYLLYCTYCVVLIVLYLYIVLLFCIALYCIVFVSICNHRNISVHLLKLNR